MKEQNFSAKKIKDVVLYRNDERFSTFPWAVKNGNDIVVAFRQAGKMSVDAAKNDLVTHHDTESWISSITVDKDFKNINQKECKIIYKSKYGVNDPGITLTKDGKILLRVTELIVKNIKDRHTIEGKIIAHRPEHGTVTKARANKVIAYDTKFEKTLFESDVITPELTDSCSREPVVELKDGTLVLSVYKGAPYTTDISYLVRSYDGGKTWWDASIVACDYQSKGEYQGINFNETSIMPIDDKTLLAMVRADSSFHTENEYMAIGGVGNLYTAVSYNAGLAWTKPKSTPIFGQPAHILKLKNGIIVATYGYRKKPYGVRVVVSYDNGETWDTKNEIILRDDGFTWDLGYPMTLEIEDNKLLTVYYFNDESRIRFIAGTVWEYRC